MEYFEKEELDYCATRECVEDEKIGKLTAQQLMEMIHAGDYALLDRFPVSIYWKDKNGMILGCNQFIALLSGYNSPVEIIGKMDYDLLPAKEAEIVRKTDQLVMETGQEIQLTETLFVEKMNQKRIFHTTKCPFVDKNKQLIGVLGFSIDITGRQALKQQLQQEKLKFNVTQMVNVTATHDLKNDLFFLSLTAERVLELIEKMRSNTFSYFPTQKDWDFLWSYAENNLQRTKRMHQIIQVNNLLLQHLLSQDGEDLYEEFDYFDIKDCVEEVLKNFSYRLPSHIVQISVENFDCFAHPILVEQILGNLLSNALRQIEEKKQGKIYIYTSCDEQFNILRVRDTAGGVSLERVAEIFTAYKTKKVAGTGLGLRSAQIFMQLMHGKIQAELVAEDCIEFSLFFKRIKYE